MALDILSLYKYDKKLENFVPRQIEDDRQGRRYNVNWGGGGGVYIHVMPVRFKQFKFDLKRNSSGRT